MAQGHIRVRQEWSGNRILGRLGPVRRSAVRRGAYQWLARSQELVPLREGHLQRSGTVEMDGNSAQVVYRTVYAEIQHRRTDFRHLPGRTDHYITKAARPDDLRQTIAGELRRLFR